MVERRLLRINGSWVPVHADIDRDRRLASAGERRGSHIDLIGPQCIGARRGNRFSDPGRVSVAGRSDLSGVANGLAEPARDCPQDRSGCAGRHPYRDRGPDRMGGAGLLPPPPPRLHHLLYDALPGIYRGTLDHSRRVELCGAAALSFGRRHDDGRDLLAQAGTHRKRVQEARHLDARGRHRTVQAGRRGRARFAETDFS